MAHEEYMKCALELAKKAFEEGEIPVGALVINRRGETVGEGYNTREREQNALRHAEITAIERACEAEGSWRLEECTLYVTLEPCPMCAGAAINSRIKRVVFGAFDLKAGCCGSVTDLFKMGFNHRPEALGGVLEEECAALLKKFFESKRERGTKNA